MIYYIIGTMTFLMIYLKFVLFPVLVSSNDAYKIWGLILLPIGIVFVVIALVAGNTAKTVSSPNTEIDDEVPNARDLVPEAGKQQ